MRSHLLKNAPTDGAGSLERYRGYVGTAYLKATRGGGTVLPMLECIWGLPWDHRALDVVSALRPSYIRVVEMGGELAADFRTGRVTVFLRGDDIERIHQEVAVDLHSDFQNGADLARYVELGGK